MSAATPEHRAQAPIGVHGPFVPLLVFMITFLGWGAIQTTQLVSDRFALLAAAAQQTVPLEAARKIRLAADSLATKTQALADKGNPDAKAVIAQLKQRGITINANTSPSPPP